MVEKALGRHVRPCLPVVPRPGHYSGLLQTETVFSLSQCGGGLWYWCWPGWAGGSLHWEGGCDGRGPRGPE